MCVYVTEIYAQGVVVVVFDLFDIFYQISQMPKGVLKFVHELGPLDRLKSLIDHLEPDPSCILRCGDGRFGSPAAVDRDTQRYPNAISMAFNAASTFCRGVPMFMRMKPLPPGP